ncbi:MAG: hypothetical protein JXB35_15365 [Anaerolineae bacterium]|nr:hypothetical protein [Anaerolineae bacterium]
MHTLKTRWLWITLLLLTLACSGLPGGELIGGNHDEGGAPLQQLGESRAQPYPANTVVFTENARVKVNGFIRGAAAWELLHEANQFNQPPPEGWEYLLVDLDLRWTGKDSEFRWLSCTVTGSALRVHQAFAAVVPEPRAKFDFRSQKHSAGWAAYLIQEGEGNLIVIVEETGNMESAPRYIALEDNAAILVDLALLDIEPTAVGSDLNAPAPLGTTVTTKDWEITALDVIRGEKAWQAIIEANQFNAPPQQASTMY